MTSKKMALRVRGGLALLLVAASVVAVVQPSQPVSALNGQPLAFGAFAQPQGGQTLQQSVTALETQIGRKLETVRVFETWGDAFPDSYHNFLKSGDRTIMLSVKPNRNGTRVQWTTIANAAPGSQVDNEIRSWARRIRDFQAPIYVTLHHEPEASANTAYGTNTDFINAWRHWVDVFRAEGATNAKFIWIMTDYAFHLPTSDRRHAPRWYPGDGWVDAMAIDAYNWHVCRPDQDNVWKPLSTIIEPFRAFGALHPSKALWLTEWASWEDPTVANRKAGWIDQARALFKGPNYQQFAGVVYFHSRAINATFDDCVWRVDTSASSLAAFRAMANDPYYMGDAFSAEQPNQAITFVAQASANLNSASHRVVVPAGVQAGDGMIMALTLNNNATVSGPTGLTGWRLLGTETNGSTSTRVWTRVATAGNSGAAVTIGSSITAKSNLALSIYRGTSTVDPVAAFDGALETVSRAAHTTPAIGVNSDRSWVVWYWAHEDSSTTALVPPADVTVRSSGTQTGGGRITALLADSNRPAGLGTAAGRTATAASATTNATMWSIVLAPS